MTSESVPCCQLRINVDGAPWHEVSPEVYARVERRHTDDRDGARLYSFRDHWVEGVVEWSGESPGLDERFAIMRRSDRREDLFMTEGDVIRGNA